MVYIFSVFISYFSQETCIQSVYKYFENTDRKQAAPYKNVASNQESGYEMTEPVESMNMLICRYNHFHYILQRARYMVVY